MDIGRKCTSRIENFRKIYFRQIAISRFHLQYFKSLNVWKYVFRRFQNSITSAWSNVSYQNRKIILPFFKEWLKTLQRQWSNTYFNMWGCGFIANHIFHPPYLPPILSSTHLILRGGTVLKCMYVFLQFNLGDTS